MHFAHIIKINKLDFLCNLWYNAVKLRGRSPNQEKHFEFNVILILKFKFNKRVNIEEGVFYVSSNMRIKRTIFFTQQFKQLKLRRMLNDKHNQ